MPDITPVDARALAMQAQGALFGLLQETTNETDKQVIRLKIARVGEVLEDISFAMGTALANDLNDLSDQLVAATATVKLDPFGPALRELQAAFDHIGNALGTTARQLKGGIAAPSPGISPVSQPPATVEPPPAAPARKAKTTVSTGAAATDLLRDNYAELFKSCTISPEHASEVRQTTQRIAAGAARYDEVSTALGGNIPWFVIGLIHAMEASLSFSVHLHNGNPLTARTTDEPIGRPLTGAPTFSWRDSACDALQMKHLDDVLNWTLPAILDRLERYNGIGYIAQRINSPYLWSGSQHWTRGKFVRDHVFDPNAPSRQCGAAVLLRDLVDAGIVELDGPKSIPTAQAALGRAAIGLPGAVQAAAQPGPAGIAFKSARDELTFPGVIQADSNDKDAVRRVQEWCSFHRAHTPVDNAFGGATSAAVAQFQQQLGIPATGIVDERTWAALTAPMLAALVPVPGAPASLNEAVIAVGRQHVAQRPIELGGDNMGAWVRLYMDGKDGADREWCAGFACFVIAQAAEQLGQSMPIKRQVGVQALIDDAKHDGRFIAGTDVATQAARQARLKPGCLFVIESAGQSHAGIVSSFDADSFATLEGNTNSGDIKKEGSDRGFEAIASNRGYPGKDFVLLG